MSYLEDYIALKKIFTTGNSKIFLQYNNIDIINIPFSSGNIFLEPLESRQKGYYISRDTESNLIEQHNFVDDLKIDENNNFNYSFFKQRSREKSKRIIILLHGFNEKHWDKYLPWAKSLLERTGKDVVLFPISFHMNRAPKSWSNPRLMDKLSKYRRELFSFNSAASYVNASISNRLQLEPIRFLQSGIKTINDITGLISSVRKNEHPYIAPDATIDFFGYSIGAFLSEILLMINPHKMFNESKLFIFCGGSTFNKMHPVSKFIIDYAANYALQKYYVTDFEEIIKSNLSVRMFFKRFNAFAIHFKCMLNYNKMKSYREKKLRELSRRITALGLKKDLVFPPDNIMDTLKGGEHNIPVNVKIIDFPFEYDHVIPFPVNEKVKDVVDMYYNKVFDFAAESLS